MEKRNAIKKTKEDTSKQSIILSEERFVFLSKNKYRKKRNYNEMIKEVEEAQKIYQANLSLTESKPSQSVTKRLGDLDSKDIEEIQIEIGRAVQQECENEYRMPSSA